MNGTRGIGPWKAIHIQHKSYHRPFNSYWNLFSNQDTRYKKLYLTSVSINMNISSAEPFSDLGLDNTT